MSHAEPEPVAPLTPPVAAEPGRILIVDDDQMMCEAMELTLGQLDLEISWRTSGHDAIALVAEREFDVILTDLTMPMMSGLELCGRVLAICPDMPVVVVTGQNRLEAALAAIRAGAYDFVVKPVDGAVLALTVSRAVQHRRLLDEVKRLRMELARRGGQRPR